MRYILLRDIPALRAGAILKFYEKERRWTVENEDFVNKEEWFVLSKIPGVLGGMLDGLSGLPDWLQPISNKQNTVQPKEVKVKKITMKSLLQSLDI